MKQNLLKLLMLASTLTLSLAACNNDKDNSSSSNNQSSSTVEESSSTIEESSSTVEESSSSEEESSSSSESSDNSSSSGEERPQFIIELNKTIYVKGDNFDESNVLKWEMWNDILETYGTMTKGEAGIAWSVSRLPAECPNGPVEITLSKGSIKAKTTVYYYDDLKTAAEKTKIDIPDDAENYLDSKKYVYTSGSKKGQLKFNASEIDGKLVVEPFSLVRPKKNYNNIIQGLAFSSNELELWDESSNIVATYDTTKKTIPHFVDGGTTYPNTTYMANTDFETPKTSIYAYDIIVDGEGHVAYMSRLNYVTPVDVTSDKEYWSYYKDYTSNPAFVFADDFDANDEEKKYNYEKVIPEGGFWIVGYNNGMANYSLGDIDSLYSSLAGVDKTYIYNDYTGFRLTLANEFKELALNKSLLTYDATSDASTYTIKLTAEADTYQSYYYYKKLVDTMGNDDLVKKGEEIYNALIMQKLPDVQAEINLFKYYESQTKILLEEWISAIHSAKA